MDSPLRSSSMSRLSPVVDPYQRARAAAATPGGQFYKSLRCEARPFRAGMMQRSPSGVSLSPLVVSPSLSPSRPRTTHHHLPFGSGPIVLSPLASSGDLGGAASGMGALRSDRPDLARLYNLHRTPAAARWGNGGNEPGNPSFYPLGLGRAVFSTRC